MARFKLYSHSSKSYDNIDLDSIKIIGVYNVDENPYPAKTLVGSEKISTRINKVRTAEQFKSPVLGFRNWRVDADEGLLLSSMKATSWQPGVNLANTCEGHSHPVSGCHCGWYAYYRLSQAQNSSYSGILGACAGAGNVELHETGFRSSEVQILALFFQDQELKYKDKILTFSDIEKIAARYKVPVFTEQIEFLYYVENISDNIVRR